MQHHGYHFYAHYCYLLIFCNIFTSPWNFITFCILPKLSIKCVRFPWLFSFIIILIPINLFPIHIYIHNYHFDCPYQTYLLTYFIEQSPSWEANRFSASQEIPRTLGNQSFIAEFTSARCLSILWASFIQSMPPHPISSSSILILSSHPNLGLCKWSLSLRFPHQSLSNAVHNTHALLKSFSSCSNEVLPPLVISSFVLSSLHMYQGQHANLNTA